MKANKTIAELISELSAGGEGRNRAAGRLMSLAENSPEQTVEILIALKKFSKRFSLFLKKAFQKILKTYEKCNYLIFF